MNLNTRLRLRDLLLLLIILLATGCDQQRVAQSSTTHSSDPINQALQQARMLSSPEAEAALLTAVELLIEQQRYPEANEWLNTLSISQLTPPLRVRAIAASTELALARNDTQYALSILTTDRLGLLSAQPAMTIQDASLFSLLRARTYEHAGDYLLAAHERIFLAPLLESEAHDRNHEQIWLNLTALPLELLNELRETAPLTEAKGWIELAWLYKAYQDNLDRQISLIQSWRENYSHHAAAIQLPQTLAKLLELVDSRPNQIAVLLPQSGRFQSAGQAIIQGFMAAHFAAAAHQNDDSTPIQLRFYDTANTAQFAQIFQQAIEDGAELIIGPLQKELVTYLHEHGEPLPVPTLALNYTDPPATPQLLDGLPLANQTPANLFQFGLSAEQEAELVALRAFRYEHKRAAVFYPMGEWGERVQQAFVNRWSELGGNTLATFSYDNQAGFANSIRQLLLMPESEARVAELRQLIGPNFEHEPRRRHDIDFVVLIANPAQGRQIKPLFNFHYAANLPILSTSHVFSGEINSAQDRDLNRVEFCDIPWFFGEQSDAKQRLQAAWPKSDPRFSRMNALGVDAYRLISRIQLLVTVPGSTFYGATGALSLGNDNRIRRNLSWYRIRQGIPEPAPVLVARSLDSIEETEADDAEHIIRDDKRSQNSPTNTWPTR